ncbi:hypothetical protein BJ875DRAFT_178961 [Amylocarpus encephaloides]|uniref:Zn(2)-C6 fungal-type domain-containing protein n=1 Tax=Amylocarpus encephaloides TaxID=45428 RepID=A0A9P7YNI2_9HELO|nr:hypothetical protein BJ875DRAFT_178961 [Amylocarpus encephaloides]
MSDSTSGGPSSSQNPSRQQRGAIATQACENCRTRKQRCDETRPKCGHCTKMKAECRYREPQPTKKDKTLVEILDRLSSLEGKIDRLPLRPPAGFGPPQNPPSDQPSSTLDSEPYRYTPPERLPSYVPNPGTISAHQLYRHTSSAHKMLTWPAVQNVLIQAMPSNIGDLRVLEQDGAAFMVQTYQNTSGLPLDEKLQDLPFVGMQTQATRTAGGARFTFPALTRETVDRLATAYFETFNVIYPFMDRQNFLSDTLVKVQTEGFDGDKDSVIALLVFALGELALEGLHGLPIESNKRRMSGVRGGTSNRPPGLALFNEARARMGFVLTECDLENIQIFSLAALYHECSFRHLDFWRLTVSASLACKILVTCNKIDWESPRGDLTKRAYWHCVLMETGLHLELDLPLTGIMALEDQVGLPFFNEPFCEADHRANQSSHFQAHYASQIALRRLCADVHNSLNDSVGVDTPSVTTSEEYSGPIPINLKQLAKRLIQWRELLPLELQWAEDNPISFPSPQVPNTGSSQNLDPELSPRLSRAGLFTSDLESEPVQYNYLYDLQVAMLRTRYYCVKYMVYRPFVYKALHYPDHITTEDAEGVAECLRTCIMWPILFSPTSRRKRLIPYLFCWSQHFLGILIILHLTRHNIALRNIRAQLCGPRFEAEADQSIALMLDWIWDLRSSDPVAMWCWNILKGIYKVE